MMKILQTIYFTAVLKKCLNLLFTILKKGIDEIGQGATDMAYSRSTVW